MILPRALLVILATVPLARAEDAAAVAIASLTDPAKLATLSGERPANPRLKKAVYWLAEARGRGRTPAEVIAEAQRLNGDAGEHAALVAEQKVLAIAEKAVSRDLEGK